MPAFLPNYDQVRQRILYLGRASYLSVVVLMIGQQVLGNGLTDTDEPCVGNPLTYTDEACGGSDEVEIGISWTYEPCESDKLMMDLEKRVGSRCNASLDSCIDVRTSEYDVSLEDATNYCLNRSLPLDPSYKGPCPDVLVELESNAYDGDEWLLDRAYARLDSNQYNEHGVRVFGQRDTARRLRTLLAAEPDNLAALGILTVLFEENGVLETIKLEIKQYELERDCRKHWIWFPTWMYNHVNELIDNWLAGNGVGSELTKNELRGVIQHVQRTLVDLYDNAMDKSNGIYKLRYAMDSISDPILTGDSDDLKQIAVQLGIDMENHEKKRRATVVHTLAREYGLTSKHDYKESLRMMCNDYAFEIGLEDQCFKLLDHYGSQIRINDESLAIEWTQAAMLLVNQLTRDCSKPLDSSGPTKWCISDHYRTFSTRLKDVLSSIPDLPATAERELLEAYLRMDETSDKYFLRSLALDESKVEFAEVLSRRLHRRGELDAALNILKASIDVAKQKLENRPELAVAKDGETQKENRDSIRLRRLERNFNAVSQDDYRNCTEPFRDYLGREKPFF